MHLGRGSCHETMCHARVAISAVLSPLLPRRSDTARYQDGLGELARLSSGVKLSAAALMELVLQFPFCCT